MIPNSQIVAIPQGAIVVLVYDTDVENTAILKKNINRLNSVCRNIKLVNLAQVKNFEDEIERATDVRKTSFQY